MRKHIGFIILLIVICSVTLLINPWISLTRNWGLYLVWVGMCGVLGWYSRTMERFFLEKIWKHEIVQLYFEPVGKLWNTVKARAVILKRKGP